MSALGWVVLGWVFGYLTCALGPVVGPFLWFVVRESWARLRGRTL